MIRVLVVDDHSMVREGLASVLAAEGDIAVVATAANGAEALAAVASVEVDVAVMDLSMPVMDGVEATRALRARVPGIRVLVLRDVPSAVQEAPDCVAQHLGDLDACSNPERRALEPDPLAAAAAADPAPEVHLVDLTDRFCRDGRCHVVIGGILAYLDHGHMTTAFARTLVPDLEPALVDILGGS